MADYTKYQRGSEWRRWDLHLHAPSEFTCAKNDQYEGKDLAEKQRIFIDELKKEGNVSVLGITDYFSLDGYKMVMKHKSELNQYDLILPNIELRITPITDKKNKINLHVIPNITVLSIDDIERYLHKFEFNKKSCKKEDLIKIGRITDTGISEEEAFRRGLNEFHISYDKFFEVLEAQDTTFKNNVLIGVSNSNNDGLSGIKDLPAIRTMIYRGVDFIFSSNPSDATFFAGISTNQDHIIELYGSLKPCYHGCDYHGSQSHKVIFQPDLNRNCWIKANPTFEGLRQTLYEPYERVRVQPSIPEDKLGYQVINKIIIRQELIHNSEVNFNENLNSIIGGRSSGKSVLLLAIAKKLKNSTEQMETKKEYHEFVEQISNTISIVWKNGEVDVDREVEYFEQGYMNRIATNETALNNIIKEILHQKGKGSHFNKYNIFLEDNSQKIEIQARDFFSIQRELDEVKQKISDIGDIQGVRTQIEKINLEIRKLSDTAVSDKDKQEYETISLEIEKNNIELQILEKDIEISNTIKIMPFLRDNLDRNFVSLSSKSRVNFNQELEKITNYVEHRWKKAVDSFISQCQTNLLELNKLNLDLNNNNSFKKVKDYYSKNNEIKALESTLLVEKGKLNHLILMEERANALQNKLNGIKLSIFSLNYQFYSEIISLMDSLNLQNDIEGVVIKAVTTFNSLGFSQALASMINQQSRDNRDLSTFNYDNVNSLIETQKVLFDLIEHSTISLKSSYTRLSILSSIFTTNYFNISFEVQYEGDKFNQMSDGKKAFVILKMLLDFSNKDCPILIDQPEDDLDNRAIFKDLVSYIRKKKKDRQIIIATHNSNIVVGADSDLVICANQNGSNNKNTNETKFQYISGALEHTYTKDNNTKEILLSQGMREHVCEILEGGNDAFKLREKKYGIIY